MRYVRDQKLTARFYNAWVLNRVEELEALIGVLNNIQGLIGFIDVSGGGTEVPGVGLVCDRKDLWDQTDFYEGIDVLRAGTWDGWCDNSVWVPEGVHTVPGIPINLRLNTFIGPEAGKTVTVGNECIVVGAFSDSMKYDRCILLGPNLKAEHDYHFQYRDTFGTGLNYTMVEEEWRPVYESLTNLLKNVIVDHNKKEQKGKGERE